MILNKVGDGMIKSRWKLTIDDKKLKVFLHVEPDADNNQACNELELNQDFIMRPEDLIKVTNDGEILKIMAELESMKVCKGIRYEEMIKALNASKQGCYIIACGIEPIEGRDGWLEVPNYLASNGNSLTIQASDKIDYQELINIPLARSGQVIALIHPPMPGCPGITVTNETISPRQVMPILVQRGRGVDIVDNGTKIIATETGRLWLEQVGMYLRVSVLPIFTQMGDVDSHAGNISFDGDVEVVGSVKDGKSIRANGNISITHHVKEAKIHAKHSVYIGQTVSDSTIIAGDNTLIVSELTSLLTNAHFYLEKLILSIHQLKNIPAFKMTDIEKKGLLPLIKLLLEHKFSSLSSVLQDYIRLCNNEKNFLDPKWKNIGERIERCFFVSAPNEIHAVEQIEQLLNDILYLLNQSKEELPQYGSVELFSAYNTTISSIGDVTIYGEGCDYTKIHCGGVIRINGIVRSGELYAGQGAIIKGVVSELNEPTIIKVPKDKEIVIGEAKKGTVLYIGGAKCILKKDRNNITARFDELNGIVLQ